METRRKPVDITNETNPFVIGTSEESYSGARNVRRAVNGTQM